jgi:hypothetical protein
LDIGAHGFTIKLSLKELSYAAGLGCPHFFIIIYEFSKLTVNRLCGVADLRKDQKCPPTKFEGDKGYVTRRINTRNYGKREIKHHQHQSKKHNSGFSCHVVTKEIWISMTITLHCLDGPTQP